VLGFHGKYSLSEVEGVRQPAINETGMEADWREQYLQDQYYTLDTTKNALFAGLAVSAAAVVERTMLMLCRDRGEHLGDRSGWAQARPALERLIGSELHRLNGFPEANRARLLGNCFKHYGGRRNQEFVDSLQEGAVGQDIRYENEDWHALIEGVQTYLTGLAAEVWH
jgi:hypothetical protein